MPETLALSPDGLHVFRFSRKRQGLVRCRPKRRTVLTHLRSQCEIVEGTTLRDIFEVVDRYPLLKRVIAAYSWCREIEEFHAQACEPMREKEPGEGNPPIEYLEIYHHADVYQSTKSPKHPDGRLGNIPTVEFGTSVGLHGVGDPEKGYEDDPCFKTDSGKINYSVSLTPMWELADLPVKLNKAFTVYDPFDHTTHSPENPPRKLISATRDFTLLEVLDAIYWDISFHGGPAEKQDFSEQLKERLDEVKSGAVAGIPLEQVRKRLEGSEEVEAPEEGEMKVVLHPDVARMLGVDPDSIPLDDKEIFRPDDDKTS